jgi:hypothetical protein
MSEEKLDKKIEKSPAEILTEILETDRKILKDVKFIKNYFHGQVIWNGIKIVLLIGIFVLGIISFRSVFSYAKNYLNNFSTPLEMTK